MFSFNNFQETTAIGHLGKDPVLTILPSGTAVARFDVACNRYKKGAENNRETEWYKCVAWERDAEMVAKYMQKGSAVIVKGRQETRNYTSTKTGQPASITELIASVIILMDGSPRPTSDAADFEEEGAWTAESGAKTAVLD